MPRTKTPEQRAAWAEYMREYRRRANGPRDPRGTRPTQRQLEILRAYADPANGGSQKTVAAQLGVTPSAVNNAIQRLMQRLHVKDPAQAVYKLWVQQDGTTQSLPEPARREAEDVDP